VIGARKPVGTLCVKMFRSDRFDWGDVFSDVYAALLGLWRLAELAFLGGLIGAGVGLLIGAPFVVSVVAGAVILPAGWLLLIRAAAREDRRNRMTR
jgi:hypothetical protein